MDELTQRIHDLPPELFNRIYELTFTAKPTLHRVNEHYKPSPLLAVDRASRQLFAASYYGQGSTFHVHWNGDHTTWLASLPIDHQRLLHDVRVEPSSRFPFAGRSRAGQTLFLAQQRYHLLLDLRKKDIIGVRKDCVHLGLRFSGEVGVFYSDETTRKP